MRAVTWSLPLAQLVADLCAAHGVANVVISPGSRSAPLTAAFAQHPAFTCRVVPDERSAAFIALGMAQQTRQASVLICTSGTAGLNYAPALAEADYQHLPLLVLTADRPPEWLDQQDNQTSHQNGWYGDHVRASFTLPTDLSHPDARWHAGRLINQALHRTRYPIGGPVHLNIPLREPLYPRYPKAETADSAPESLPVQVIDLAQPQLTLDNETWRVLVNAWQNSARKLIVVGAGRPDSRVTAALTTLQSDPSVAVVSDIGANVWPAPLSHADSLVSSFSLADEPDFAPDLLLSFGGPLVSKALKLFLRRQSPAQHWRLDPAGGLKGLIDTYQNLSQLIPVESVYFLARLAALQSSATPGDIPATKKASYQARWLTRNERVSLVQTEFLRTAPFGEFTAIRQVLEALPPASHLQLGNSMPVRYVSYLGLPGEGWRVDANRGTSGIDGTVSTAVGAALVSQVPTVLLVGDLGFFYDKNGLWHQHLPANLKLILLNNHGGGIFQMIGGPNQLPAALRETYFDTPHPLTAERTAADVGLRYFHATTASTLAEVLPPFFAPETGPALLEIESEMAVNRQVFDDFRQRLKAMGKN